MTKFTILQVQKYTSLMSNSFSEQPPTQTSRSAGSSFSAINSKAKDNSEYLEYCTLGLQDQKSQSRWGPKVFACCWGRGVRGWYIVLHWWRCTSSLISTTETIYRYHPNTGCKKYRIGSFIVYNIYTWLSHQIYLSWDFVAGLFMFLCSMTKKNRYAVCACVWAAYGLCYNWS